MDKETIATYDRAAKAYAEKFAGIGPRVSDIEVALAAFGKENPQVLELGCGDGRDAVEICKRTDNYFGIDASKEMVMLAREKVPNGTFSVENIDTFPFTAPVDVIFAFASLLHVPKEVFERVLQKAYVTIPSGGIFYLSLKEGRYTGAEVVKDEWGERLFYYYEEGDIRDMAQEYEIMFLEKYLIGHTKWIRAMLRKAK
ncbi:MAG: class I SAM-dependent methyltransferase [Candidatus Pacebacteria bacterium]|nr:class I SAM-dependent methyltransferase [Candidatus Paceibacterota bacterium]